MLNLRKFRKEKPLLFWAGLIICLTFTIIFVLSIVDEVGDLVRPVSFLIALMFWGIFFTIIKFRLDKK